MHNLTIRHKDELPLHQIIGASALTFSKWFPLDEKDRIIVNEDDEKVIIWFIGKNTKSKLEHPKPQFDKFLHDNLDIFK